MAGISISNLITKEPTQQKKRRAIPNLSSLSSDYSNPKKEEVAEAPPEETNGKESVTKASLERSQRVTRESLERHESVTKTSLQNKGNLRQHQSVTKASLERRPEREQERDENVTKASLERDQIYEISELSTQEDNLLRYLFETCSLIGQRETPKMANHEIISFLKTSTGGLRSLLLRLKKKGFLSVIKTKNGPSGWRIYELPEVAYKHFANQKNIERASLKRDESVAKASPNASLGALLSSPSSNSSYKLNTNTTEDNFDAGWNLIQTPELLKELGFGKSHIDQIKNKFEYSPEEVSKFLESFAFDLKNGERDRLKAKGINPIGYFFGALKQGGYNPVTEGFKTSEELAQEEMIARLEARKKEREEKEQNLQELLFDEWVSTKSKDELCQIEKPINSFLDLFHKSALKNYFLEHEFESFRPSYG